MKTTTKTIVIKDHRNAVVLRYTTLAPISVSEARELITTAAAATHGIAMIRDDATGTTLADWLNGTLKVVPSYWADAE